MIVDQYYPDYDGRAWVYTRWRDDEGALIERHVSPREFEPYFWIPASTRPALVDRVISRYPGSRVEWEDRAESVPDTEHGSRQLVKIIAHKR